ncbi:MAG: hypothetical protein KAW88_03525, partial [Candidatus Cloacimonetes bacterium]|nr:hypothetical protein [Candidatus Cloacimonadota bacterium]
MEEKKIIKADKNFRKLVIIFIIFLVIFGIFFINYFQKYLRNLETLVDNSTELAIKKILSILKIVSLFPRSTVCVKMKYLLIFRT